MLPTLTTDEDRFLFLQDVYENDAASDVIRRGSLAALLIPASGPSSWAWAYTHHTRTLSGIHDPGAPPRTLVDGLDGLTTLWPNALEGGSVYCLAPPPISSVMIARMRGVAEIVLPEEDAIEYHRPMPAGACMEFLEQCANRGMPVRVEPMSWY